MATWFYWLDLFGVVVFALSGVLMAGRLRLDPFGVLVLATVTAIGGGTIRDVLIGARPLFWIADPTYLWVILATVAASIMLLDHFARTTEWLSGRLTSRGLSPRTILLWADAFGLALFTVLGTQKALSFDSPAIVAVGMGLLTGVAGGMIRDLLGGAMPLILQREIYATAAIAGASTQVVLLSFGLPSLAALWAGLATTLLLRLAAIKWHLSLPPFDLNRQP
ncbi:trimeric intracellular cation channel family protein [Gallaecimonas sp. GXIMD4217]|uniref:trimeric intracellular cation channel family protein n=1 Tax=Gallaecimonas sp. GXIMD4217 TaxID=3131927 RepID=UPI00311AEF61